MAYIVVQLLGGIAGAVVLSFVLDGADSSLGVTVLADNVSPVQGLILEAILTFFLLNVIFNAMVSGKAGNLAPVAIGLTKLRRAGISLPLFETLSILRTYVIEVQLANIITNENNDFSFTREELKQWVKVRRNLRKLWFEIP